MIDIHRHCARGQENEKGEARIMTLRPRRPSSVKAEATQCAVSPWTFWKHGCWTRMAFVFPVSGMSHTLVLRDGSLRLVSAAEGRTQEGATARQAGRRIKKSCTKKQSSGSRRIFPQNKDLGTTSNYSLCERP